MSSFSSSPQVFFAIALVLFAVAPPGSAFPADKAEPKPGAAVGTLSLNGKRVTLRHAYALAQPNTFDKKKIDIAVLLSEKPLRDGALKDVEEIDEALKGLSGYALFKIDEAGKPIREVIDHPLLGDQSLQMSGFTNANFTSRVFGRDKDRIEGTFATTREKEFLGYRYEIKVDFAAAVVRAKLPEPLPNAKTGKALPADGGDPGKAYLARREAELEQQASRVAIRVKGLVRDLPDRAGIAQRDAVPARLFFEVPRVSGRRRMVSGYHFRHHTYPSRNEKPAFSG